MSKSVMVTPLHQAVTLFKDCLFITVLTGVLVSENFSLVEVSAWEGRYFDLDTVDHEALRRTEPRRVSSPAAVRTLLTERDSVSRQFSGRNELI
ncbi:MAG: hypothetical protein ACE5HZ_06635, partial [Fidelibacterota bacterium]